MCFCVINLASNPEERAIKYDSGKEERLIFEDFVREV